MTQLKKYTVRKAKRMMTDIEFIKWMIDGIAPWAAYSDRVDDTLTALYIAYAEALALAAAESEAA